jgi:hypothetical protein
LCQDIALLHEEDIMEEAMAEGEGGRINIGKPEY